ncbi:MAG: hypothetical protein AB1502_12760 [Thermodesulfobacteriota bacterium]
MKKFIVLSLVGLLILAFGTTVFAQKKEAPKLDFIASGFIDAQTEYFRGATGGTINPTTAGNDKERSYLETRCRLKFDAKWGKELSGTIFFEMDSSQWGDDTTVGGRNRMGIMGADQAAVEIKHVYFDIAVPVVPVPTTVRVGLQGFYLRPAILIATDATGVTAGIKVDPAKINLYWFKYLEGDVTDSDDVDIYGLNVDTKVGPVTVGGYGVFFNMNTYPVTYAATPPNKAEALYLGLYTDGKVGPVNLNFDFSYDRGKIEDRIAPIAADTKLRGWATRLKVDYPWEKFNFGVVGAYGSGSDLNKTATKIEAFVTPPGSESAAAFGESLVLFSSWVNRGNTGIRGGVAGSSFYAAPLGGLWYGKLYGSFKATPWYKVTLQALYIGDTTKHGNTIGTARKADLTTLRDDKEIGWEFDLINEFQIYKNLKYTIAGGFMTKGDGLEFYDSTLSTNVKPKTPWIIMSNLTYSF